MGLVVFEYDWIPGERPGGQVVGDPPELHALLDLRCGLSFAKGVVTAVRPDVGGITVLSIAVHEANNLQAFVEDLQADEAVDVSVISDN